MGTGRTRAWVPPGARGSPAVAMPALQLPQPRPEDLRLLPEALALRLLTGD